MPAGIRSKIKFVTHKSLVRDGGRCARALICVYNTTHLCWLKVLSLLHSRYTWKQTLESFVYTFNLVQYNISSNSRTR